MKKYMVYLDDGRDCYKVAVPAANEKAARKYVEGNGEVIAVKDITDDYPISLDKVVQALRNAQFGQTEIDLITRCLSFNDIYERQYSKKLGNSPVQEVVAGKNFYNCQNAMVITNNYFTDGAIQLAKANNVELWDRNKLMQVIYYTDSQWDELLDKIKI